MYEQLGYLDYAMEYYRKTLAIRFETSEIHVYKTVEDTDRDVASIITNLGIKHC